MYLVIDPQNPWEGNLHKLPKMLLKHGELDEDGQELVEKFIEYIKRYDYSFAYSENGIFTVVFADNKPPVSMENIAMMDIDFGSYVALMVENNIEHIGDVDSAFFEAVEELMAGKGWELSEESVNEACDFWTDDEATEAIAALLDKLPKLNKAEKALVQKYRDAMADATDFQVIITEQALVATFEIECDDEDCDEDDDDWDDDDEDEDYGDTITHSFSIQRMNGGFVLVAVGDDFANISVPQSYIDFAVSCLEQYGKGGRFGEGEALEFATESIKDDELAMALITCLQKNQTLRDNEKKLVAQVQRLSRAAYNAHAQNGADNLYGGEHSGAIYGVHRQWRLCWCRYSNGHLHERSRPKICGCSQGCAGRAWAG
jgi:hypothetical protein